MAEINHLLSIESPASDVFLAMTTPDGLNAWWTLSSSGTAEDGSIYNLNFGPGYEWRAMVIARSPLQFEWKFVKADADWMGTRVGFKLTEIAGIKTNLHFYHKDWKNANDHFNGTSYCWAMYLRLLKRFLEHGQVVPYPARLSV